MARNEEMLPIVDTDGNVTGKASRKECHDGSMLLHPVVHIHVFNDNGELLLQKRSMHKKIQPGKWDTAVGGHVDWGESIALALAREAYEEIGLVVNAPKLIFKYAFTSPVERELVNTYMVNVGNRFNPKAEENEIDELRFWSIDEIVGAIGKGILTPNFEQEFIQIKDTLGL